MFKQILNYFHDQSSPTLDVSLNILKLMLLWAPSRTKIQSAIYGTTLIFATVIMLNQLIYVIVTRNVHTFMILIQFTSYHMGIVKVATYHIWRKEWEVVIVEMSNTEKFFETDPKCNEVLKQYIKRGRTLVFGFITVAIIAKVAFSLNIVSSVIMQIIDDVPIPKRTRLFFIWWPFNIEEMPGWIADMVFQILYAYIGCLYVIVYDSLLVLIMVVFAGQMHMVTTMFKHNLSSGTLEEQKKKLIKCHQMYLAIVKFHKTCNSALSPSLFVHLLIVTLGIAVSINNMASDSTMVVSALLTMSGQLLQLILYYWHGNEVTVQSGQVSYSLFESDWAEKTLDMKRLIALLSVSTTKILYFTAGPFTTVSLSTFVAILRASYSFYTLLKNSK